LGLALTGVSLAQSSPPVKPGVTNLRVEYQPVTEVGKHNLLQLLQRGGPVMYPLYACSILVVTFWIERMVSLRRNKVIPPELLRAIQAAAGEPAARQRLADEIQANPSSLGRIVRAGYKKITRPVLEIEKAIEDAGAKEVAVLQRNNKVFSVVGTIAPLLGLLGTVTGLMRSFMTVATSAEALGRTELLAAGIYEALVATAVGLSIAIPSMALYFYYQERVDKLVSAIDEAAVEFIEKLAPDAHPVGGL
jgi:biopolymer transport protein ExbB